MVGMVRCFVSTKESKFVLNGFSINMLKDCVEVPCRSSLQKSIRKLWFSTYENQIPSDANHDNNNYRWKVFFCFEHNNKNKENYHYVNDKNCDHRWWMTMAFKHDVSSDKNKEKNWNPSATVDFTAGGSAPYFAPLGFRRGYVRRRGDCRWKI